MMTEDEKPANKPVKKERLDAEPVMPAPLASFEEFVTRAALSAVRASGLQLHLRATTGLAPRPLDEWQAAMNHYQALA